MCDPTNPGPTNVRMQNIVTGNDEEIFVDTLNTACGQTFTRRFRILVHGEGDFTLPSDLHTSTLAMLHGEALRFQMFARHGFDREP
jgi:hypothetical protein